MTRGTKSSRWRRQHGLRQQSVEAAFLMMRTGPWECELLAGNVEVELAPRPTNLVAVRSFLVTMIILQANTPGPMPG